MKKKRRHGYGLTGEIRSMEKQFEKMAEQGWMIERLRVGRARYREAEPRSLRFAVDILPKIGALDYPDSSEAVDYRRLFEDAGWEFVCSDMQIHVFCTDREDVEQIHTDSRIQCGLHMRHALKFEVIVCAVMLLTLPITMFGRMPAFIEMFFTNMGTALALSFILIIPALALYCATAIGWLACTAIAYALRRPMPVIRRTVGFLVFGLIKLAAVLSVLLVITAMILEISTNNMHPLAPLIWLPYVVIILGAWLMHRRKERVERTRGENFRYYLKFAIPAIILSLIVRDVAGPPPRDFHADLEGRPVITMLDIGVTAPLVPPYPVAEVRGSIAIPVNYYQWEASRDAAIITRVYRAVTPWLARWLYSHLAERIKEEYWIIRRDWHGENTTRGRPMTAAEAQAWGADEGIAIYYKPRNMFYGGTGALLRRGNEIVRIDVLFDSLDLDALKYAVSGLWSP